MPRLGRAGGAALFLACLIGLAARPGMAQTEDGGRSPPAVKGEATAPVPPPAAPAAAAAPAAPAAPADRSAADRGIGNYLIPVPADLPKRQLDAQKRLAAQQQAERQAKQQAEDERARQSTAASRPEHQTVVMPLGGFMYH